MDEIYPFPKNFYDRCIALGVTCVTLHFSGGSDEGYLSVDSDTATNWGDLTNEQRQVIRDLNHDIESWADEKYCYSGAGDGSEYGDDVTYNFVEGTVEHQSWYTDRKYNDGETDNLVLMTGEDEDGEEITEIATAARNIGTPTLTDRLNNSVDPSLLNPGDEFGTMAQRILDNINSFVQPKDQ